MLNSCAKSIQNDFQEFEAQFLTSIAMRDRNQEVVNLNKP